MSDEKKSNDDKKADKKITVKPRFTNFVGNQDLLKWWWKNRIASAEKSK